MELSWGVDLWDRLDEIINHTNVASNFIDKFHKCFVECHQVMSKAVHKQKRILEKLQMEINDPSYTEFTMTTGLISIINNFISIYNIKSTYSNSAASCNEDLFKKSHSQIKKVSIGWVNEKRKMEDDLFKQRRKYDNSLKRYRERYQAMLVTQDNYKRSEDNRNLSKLQVEAAYQALQNRKDEYDLSKQDYAVEFRDFNLTQKLHFDEKIVQWAKKGEEIYDKKLNLIKDLSIQFSKLSGDMISKLNYSVTRFSDVATQINFSKDAILLVQKYKTGDVPPLELQFIDMDYKQYSSKPDLNKKELSDDSSTDSQFTSSIGSVDGSVKMKTHAHSNSNSSIYASSYSHDNKSDPIRSTMQTIKFRNLGSIGVNPDARISIQKSNKIFKSSTPWKNNDQTDTGSQDKTPVKQPSLYQRRGRNSARQPQNHRRSRSVTDMISHVFRSSMKLKSKDDRSPVRKKDHYERSPSQYELETSRQSLSDFDSDTDINQSSQNGRNVPDIVSTPAEAVALWNRKMSVPHECLYSTMNRLNSSPTLNEKSQNEDTYQYVYVGSCVSQHDYDSEDPSNNYLSFQCGDQFYIVKMDDGSGWLFVETIDKSAVGYVPSSYMRIRHFNNLSEAIV